MLGTAVRVSVNRKRRRYETASERDDEDEEETTEVTSYYISMLQSTMREISLLGNNERLWSDGHLLKSGWRVDWIYTLYGKGLVDPFSIGPSSGFWTDLNLGQVKLSLLK